MISMVKRCSYEYVYFLILIIYSGLGNSLVNAIRNVPHTYLGWIGFVLFTLLTIVLVLRNNVDFSDKKLFRVFCIFTLWSIFQYILYKGKSLQFGHYFYILYNILLSYIIIKVYANKIWSYYFECVYKLCVISLIFWILSLLFPQLISSLMLFKHESVLLEGNSFFFSMTNPNIDVEDYWYRNSGFSWEPGRFSCFIIIALFILLFSSKGSVFKKKQFYVLVGALGSTFSTTGYFAFFVILFITHALMNRKYLRFLLLIPFFAIVWQQDFMQSKIGKHIDVENRIELLTDSYQDFEITGAREGNVTPQRFEGLYFDILNFIPNPLLGYGRDRTNSFCSQNIYSQLTTSNGLIGCFARFGILLGFAVFFYLYKTSNLISKEFGYKGKYYFLVVYCIISISYDFIEVPLFMTFWMYSLFLNNDYKNARKKNCWNSYTGIQ